MKIKVLADTVVNQIAAGEVIERPASVVRELVDNAVDSGATDICLAVENGGHSRIRVRDNGCGMSRGDAVLAFERHATSKVTDANDLWNLSTMGFRGEALATIAAVSKVKLVTRESDAPSGTEVIFKGGKLINVTACAWSEGTEIEIEHLFFNTPARRKFLKSPRSELARIRAWFAHSAICRPSIRYRLIADGDEILNLPRVDSVEERARGVFGDGLTRVSLSEGGTTVSGIVAHPGQAIADATGLVFLVNGRLVTDKLLLRATREGFDSMLKDREFPVGVLLIGLPPQHVDVNVHPQKSEVRFRHPDQVFAAVRGAVLSAVREMRTPIRWNVPSVSGATAPQPSFHAPSEPVSISTFGGTSVDDASRGSSAILESSAMIAVARSEPSAQQPRPLSLFAGQNADRVAVSSPSYWSGSEGNVAKQLDDVSAPFPPPFLFSNLRYIGQALQCYLLCENEGRLVVVDMHAAHERINYNRIRTARAAHNIVVQTLLIPEQLVLPEEQVISLMDQELFLRELGFQIRQDGRTTLSILGVPGVMAHSSCAGIVREFAAEPMGQTWRERFEERIDHMTARLACHASVRSGDMLTREEVYALFAQLDETHLAAACPHGRPVVAEFSRMAVESWFGRDR